MVYLIIAVFLTYFLLVITLITGWTRISRNKAVTTFDPAASQYQISVIIAVRNEEAQISLLLADLAAQDYPAFEIIIVDDHSTDNTVKNVRKVLNDSRFKLLSNAGTGKKEALTTGIKACRGEIMVTTDGDCRVSPQWLAIISRYFQEDSIKMVFGGVRIGQDGSFFSTLQSIEFSSLIGSGAATLALGSPTLCNGANLAFRKSVFASVAGYEGNLHVASGDDEFLMRKIAALHPEGIRFLNDPEAVVSTKPSASIIDFLHQRIRWAGKWRHNSSRTSVLLAIVILLVQCTIGLSLVLVLANGFFYSMITLLTLRAMLEFVFLYRVCLFLKVRWSGTAFLLLQIVYPFYVVGTGLFSNFISYRWKGRELKVGKSESRKDRKIKAKSIVSTARASKEH